MLSENFLSGISSPHLLYRLLNYATFPTKLANAEILLKTKLFTISCNSGFMYLNGGKCNRHPAKLEEIGKVCYIAVGRCCCCIPVLPVARLQTQMKIMNRNLTGKLEELHGIQHVDTHVALSEIRGQLHELTRRFGWPSLSLRAT